MAMNNDAQELANYVLFEANRFHPINHNIAEESRACIFVNGQELATLMCSPHDLDDLAIGFLRSEELISSIDDIASLTLSKQGTCVDVWLTHPLKAPPVRRITTSGCGGGVTFDDLLMERNPLTSSSVITTAQVGPLMKKLYQSANLYQDTRGIHTAALCDPEEPLIIAEDIGRHNTIDRVWGRALKQGIDTQNKILISTGRISSEMLGKAAKAGIPIVISRTSPTSLSVKLARAWNITIIGYARGDSFRIYAAQDRVYLAEPINQQLPFNLPVI